MIYCTPPTTPIANKSHQCTYCAEEITKGTKYWRWASVEDAWFTNKMHDECHTALYDDLCVDDWDFTYTPFNNERPKA